MQRPFTNGYKFPLGCNGYVTAVAAGQSQRLYSGVGVFHWCYLSSPPQIMRFPVVGLELGGLIYIQRYLYMQYASDLDSRLTPSYFINISIITPVVPALKNYYI
jgi:hypothetical protein